MPLALVSKPGLTGASALSIPEKWDKAWFRGFINNLLKGADVRNAVGANGIVITGTIASPYATISLNLTTTTLTAPPAGGAAALPATPAGYVTIVIGGVARKVAFY
jgi:hypothetical protein